MRNVWVFTVLVVVALSACDQKKTEAGSASGSETASRPNSSATGSARAAGSTTATSTSTGEPKPNDPQAVACDGGDLKACVAYADKLLKGTDKEAKRGCEAPLRKACDGKIGRACSDLGSRCLPAIILADGRKTYLKDKKDKAELNEQACQFDDGLGCFNIAKNYEEGYGVDQDEAKAEERMKKALTLLPKECDAGDGKSCFSLAMLYNPKTASNRVPKDDAKSKGFYKKACDAGEELACNVLKDGPPPK